MTHPNISTFVLGEYQTNSYVVTPGFPGLQAGAKVAAATDATDPCWIIDCGLDPSEMFDWIADHHLQPQEILLTHAHLDHIAGVDQALSRFGTMPISIHLAEAGFCRDPMLNLSGLIGMDITCIEPDRYLNDGDTVQIAGESWRVMHTPGHSPGGVCFVHDESKQAIVGDTLFAGSIGRFDFPTSNVEDLRNSIDRIMQLPDDFRVYPGHGPMTTIGTERKTNPYVLGGF